MNDTIQRLAHVDKDMSLRALKARKVEALLGLAGAGDSGSLLEVGTGSGGIAHYFAHDAARPWQVSAVDVADNRELADGYDFHLVRGCILPFPNASFDVVISNHVIEHVGDVTDQLLHLRELKRVLKASGVGYLAVPNRWMLVEPHYRLAFLSWLPKSWRSPYLRCFKGQEAYDCEPLSKPGIEKLLDQAGFRYENVCLAALRVILALEKPSSPVLRALAGLPDSLLGLSLRVMPTLIYRLEP